MSESITHIGVVDDAARLALHAGDICESFKLVLRNHLDLARLGGVTRHGDLHNPGLLESFRERWPDEGLAPKLAFVLGWLSHRAADRCMKKLFRALDPECPLSPTDCSVYNDVCVFQEVYDAGRKEPYIHAILGDQNIDVSVAEELLVGMWRRTLIRMHTFKPGDADIEPWLDNVVRFQQEMRVDLKRYAKALVGPDPDKWRRFIEEPNFYDRQDALLRLVRSIQRGTPESSIDLDDAMAKAVGGCQYARCLERAFRYIKAANEFWGCRIQMEELKTRLDIGLPELS